VHGLGARLSSTIPATVRPGTAAHLIDYRPAATIDRNWTALAVRRLEADSRRSADTHLVKLPLSGPVDLYLKDESTHPTGSLKHRLARSLFLYARCNGWIGPATTVVEASSGSTAVSEAYFARLIGVPFVAVMSRATSPAKIALIKREGGRCHLIDDPTAVSDVAARLARELNGHFLDQFTYAERAADWRGNNNIAGSTLAQMALEPHSMPSWIVVGAGTGGTAATFGRYLRLRGTPTRLCVVDPSCVIAVPGTPAPTTTPGSRNTESTSTLICPLSNGPGTIKPGTAHSWFPGLSWIPAHEAGRRTVPQIGTDRLTCLRGGPVPATHGRHVGVAPRAYRPVLAFPGMGGRLGLG
jgi:cysteine synthase